MQTVTFKAGDTIIAEGEKGDTAFLIVSGAVEVSVGQGGKAKTLATLKPGEVFGEMCLIEPGPRSATVRAATETQCLVTSYDEFMASIQEDPARAVQFMRTLVRRLRQTNEQMASMAPKKGGLRAMFQEWQQSALLPNEDMPEVRWWMML
jgi:CRP/FNR family transcriptional regulator, cyclic AMP receptor protein